MPLTLKQATRAGELAAQITARRAMVTELERAIADKFTVTQLRATNPQDGTEHSLILGALDDTNSSQAFTFALNVYQQQIVALEVELADVENIPDA